MPRGVGEDAGLRLEAPQANGAAAGAFGLSLQFLATQSFAASEGDLSKKKFVFVICRGGMDGLTVSPPVGDPDYHGLRGPIALRNGRSTSRLTCHR